MPKTQDVKCWELAELFLADHPHLDTVHYHESLAAVIQDAIETWLTYELDNYEPRHTGAPQDDPDFAGFADNH